jgi:hypothetical protein
LTCGEPIGLYTAKVRPYLIKKGVEYVELNPSRATVFLACSGVARRAGSISIFLAARSWQGLVRNGTKRDPGN